MKKHTRGNRRPKVVVEARRTKVIAAVKAGKSLAQIAKETSTPKATIFEDVKALRHQFASDHPEEFASYAREALAKNELQEQAFLQGRLEAADMAVWLAITRERNKIVGAYAPEKKISLNVQADSPLQFQFLEHAHGLSEQQIEQVFAFMDGLPRERAETVEEVVASMKTPLLEGNSESA